MYTKQTQNKVGVSFFHCFLKDNNLQKILHLATQFESNITLESRDTLTCVFTLFVSGTTVLVHTALEAGPGMGSISCGCLACRSLVFAS